MEIINIIEESDKQPDLEFCQEGRALVRARGRASDPILINMPGHRTNNCARLVRMAIQLAVLRSDCTDVWQ